MLSCQFASVFLQPVSTGCQPFSFGPGPTRGAVSNSITLLYKEKIDSITRTKKVYRKVVMPAMIYGANTWSTTKKEKILEVNEMTMLRWMRGVTRKDKIQNIYEDQLE